MKINVPGWLSHRNIMISFNTLDNYLQLQITYNER